MKKLSKLFAVVAMVLAPFFASSAAFAASKTCDINYTGPDSNNLCTSKQTFKCTLNNETNTAIVNTNNQEANSGNVEVKVNTQGGAAGSGSATNDNGVTYNVKVTNDGKACVAVATVPAINKNEQGAGAAQGGGQVAPTSQAVPETLPNTSGDLFSTVLTGLASILGIGVAGLFIGVTAYRLFQS